MADNTTLNPGAGGESAASDEIDGVQYQRIKLTLGADGVNDGDVSSSNPMPVALPVPSAQALTNIDADIGAPNATAAPADGTGDYSLIGAAKRALLNWASLLARIPALVAGSVPTSPTLPRVATVTNTSATTNASGTGWTAFPAAACTAMRIINTATNGVAIEYRRGGAGVAITVPAESDAPILGITNANQIEVRRVDQSTTTQVVFAEVYQ